MVMQRNEDVKWYVATRKDSGAHTVRNENYIANYEREYERIREFDTMEEAVLALAAREAADPKGNAHVDKSAIKVGKLRGDIKKGSLDDEDLRATIRAEIIAEGGLEKPPSSKAQAGPKTTKRSEVKTKE
jgi:hypothetical protein